MGVMIKVGMADLKVCKAPDNLTTLGLGSCVGASIYDPVTKVSGMLHCMLPDSTKIANNQKFSPHQPYTERCSCLQTAINKLSTACVAA